MITIADILERHGIAANGTAICGNCGSVIRRRKTEIRRAGKRNAEMYCDRDCFNEAKSKRPSNRVLAPWGYMRSIRDNKFTGASL